MASGTLDFRFLALRALAACAVVGAIACLGACSPAASVQPLLSERCLRLGGPRQEITLPVLVPQGASGLLGVSVRERGISAVAALMADGTTREAASPIDRLGTITLARDATPGHVIPVRIASIDSRDIIADVCVSAELVRPADGPEALAWRRLAAAGEATRSRKWQSAFDRYLAAARLFDGLGAAARAADARQAMAELAYGYLQRRRDSLALVATTLQNKGRDPPAIVGARLALMAKALMDLPQERDLSTRTILATLRAAAGYFRSSADGRREIPRLAIFEGFVRYRAAHPDESYRLFERAATQCKEMGDWECFARARQNMAAISEDRQNYGAALTAYEDALRPLDRSRMAMLSADITYNLARLEGRVGLFGSSEQHQLSAMRLYARLGQCDRVRRSASSLGEMLVQVGSVSEATTYLNEAARLDCARLIAQARAEPGEGDHFPADDVADAARLQPDRTGDVVSACERSQAPDDPTLNDDIGVFQALLALGDIARTDDHLRAAEVCFSAARKYSVDSRTAVRLLNARGQLQLELRRPAIAERDFRRARQISRESALEDGSEFLGSAELGLAETALATKRYAAVLNHSFAALRLASARADVTQMVTSLRLLASGYAGTARTVLAERILRSAIGLLEQVPTGELAPDQRATYLATQYSVFGELTDLLARDARDGAETKAWHAFDVAEDGHARSLRYAMELASHEHDSTVPADQPDRYQELLRTIAAAWPRRNGSVDGQLLQVLARLAVLRPRNDASIDRTALVRNLLTARSTLVEYAIGIDEMYAFVTDGTHIHVVRLGPREAIAKSVSELRSRLRAPEPNPLLIRSAAEDLARLVLWPLRAFLRTDRIVIVPDGGLHTVPFAILPWSSGRGSELLLQHAELSAIPSAFLLAAADSGEAKPSPTARFVLLGDPVFRINIWRRECASARDSPMSDATRSLQSGTFRWLRFLPSLPGTRAEVLSVSHIVHRWRPRAKVERFLECAATPSALQAAAPGAEVIHIATHGLVDARRPRLSALAFTPETHGAPRAALRLLDILRLPIRARLVVLSACDTSQGRLLPGEGILGLAQAFLQAGARSVVASYWRVGDTDAQSFMKRFYRHLLMDGMPVAAALRRTQLELAAQGNSYGWAAFSVFGQANTSL